ncbi:MAG: hypothetical protein R3C49_18460 [Planctomycetaceae bacterium]
MQHLHFDLRTGESLRLGQFRVTVLEVDSEEVVLEIEGPGGETQIEVVRCAPSVSMNQEPVLV